MVLLWSSLATQDARLPRAALGRMRPIPPVTSWVTYVRGHDDIGWAVSDVDAAAVGSDGFGHRRFLNDFFSGRFPHSPAWFGPRVINGALGAPKGWLSQGVRCATNVT